MSKQHYIFRNIEQAQKTLFCIEFDHVESYYRRVLSALCTEVDYRSKWMTFDVNIIDGKLEPFTAITNLIRDHRQIDMTLKIENKEGEKVGDFFFEQVNFIDFLDVADKLHFDFASDGEIIKPILISFNCDSVRFNNVILIENQRNNPMDDFDSKLETRERFETSSTKTGHAKLSNFNSRTLLYGNHQLVDAESYNEYYVQCDDTIERIDGVDGVTPF